MPDYDHPGFRYWPANDPAFPIGEVTKTFESTWGASAWCDIQIPASAPFPKTVAARFIGLARSAKLWFALECTTGPQGQFSYEAVLRAQHVHWWDEHGESGPGPVWEHRLPGLVFKGWGSQDAQLGHGQHCDAFEADWRLNGMIVRATLSVHHFDGSIRAYLADRERRLRELEQRILTDPPGDEPLPPEPAPVPEPTPGT